ncbi:hypothetical protein [Nitrosomonas sp.]|uniref:hypothetical protein n=1 Tax=Nitrosomonas sp. TaxID=42353 RepID=UPI001D30CFA4|nr:hypothetical protein [Nitrosomonas sp.]MBX3616709.1 hypothetical protein [Nitrosomonas sp.]
MFGLKQIIIYADENGCETYYNWIITYKTKRTSSESGRVSGGDKDSQSQDIEDIENAKEYWKDGCTAALLSLKVLMRWGIALHCRD